MKRQAKCQVCGRAYAEWAMQYVGEDKPTFSTMGSHYRGFAVTKVCDACKEEIKNESYKQSIMNDSE